MKYQCIQCKNALEDEDGLFGKCPKCGFSNQRINNVPIILDNIRNYISDKLYSFTSNINNLENSIQSISRSKHYTPDIEKNISIIKNKIELINSLRDELIPYANTVNLLHKAFDFKEQGYNLNYDYLLRDWGNFEETERENNIIYEYIKSKITQQDNSTALVLGAGLGRLAVELTNDFGNVYAIDLSYEMARLFNMIKESSMEIEAVLLKNSGYDDKNYISTTIQSSKITESAGGTDNLNKLRYYIADVRKLFFSDNSFDCIISCYFTDVMPIDEYFHEIDRVLKNDGYFIHFGPLDYHFENDLYKMLSIKELIEVFRNRGYELEMYDPILLEHLSIPIRGLKKIYNNWFFKAKKKALVKQKVTPESFLEINGPINYEICRSLTTESSGTGKDKIKIHTPIGTVYECYMDTLNIIQEFDGTRSIDDIFTELETQFNVNDNVKNAIMNILDILLNNGILLLRK
jgi:SAM-dependent methyltransferase